MPDVLLEVDAEGVALITLNRPRQRNSMSANLSRELAAAIRECEERDDVKAAVLTGAGTAFCAGIDLKEFASQAKGGVDPRAGAGSFDAERFLAQSKGIAGLGNRRKLLIGAINGPSVTGGLELALNCDFLIASTHASFADTHARVGVMPGGGLTVLLPQWIGVPRARQMSVTGNYVFADQALAWGLVNEVVEPEGLLPRALARTAASIEAVPQLLATYEATTGGTVSDAWVTEQLYKRDYDESDGAEVGRRYGDIRDRGRGQHKL
jgi:enoyl-CoA hydratase